MNEDQEKILLKRDLEKAQGEKEVKEVMEDAQTYGHEDIVKLAQEKLEALSAKAKSAETIPPVLDAQVKAQGGSVEEEAKRAKPFKEASEEIERNTAARIQEIAAEGSTSRLNKSPKVDWAGNEAKAAELMRQMMKEGASVNEASKAGQELADKLDAEQSGQEAQPTSDSRLNKSPKVDWAGNEAKAAELIHQKLKEGVLGSEAAKAGQELADKLDAEQSAQESQPTEELNSLSQFYQENPKLTDEQKQIWAERFSIQRELDKGEHIMISPLNVKVGDIYIGKNKGALKDYLRVLSVNINQGGPNKDSVDLITEYADGRPGQVGMAMPKNSIPLEIIRSVPESAQEFQPVAEKPAMAENIVAPVEAVEDEAKTEVVDGKEVIGENFPISFEYLGQHFEEGGKVDYEITGKVTLMDGPDSGNKEMLVVPVKYNIYRGINGDKNPIYKNNGEAEYDFTKPQVAERKVFFDPARKDLFFLDDRGRVPMSSSQMVTMMEEAYSKLKNQKQQEKIPA